MDSDLECVEGAGPVERDDPDPYSKVSPIMYILSRASMIAYPVPPLEVRFEPVWVTG